MAEAWGLLLLAQEHTHTHQTRKINKNDKEKIDPLITLIGKNICVLSFFPGGSWVLMQMVVYG